MTFIKIKEQLDEILNTYQRNNSKSLILFEGDI